MVQAVLILPDQAAAMTLLFSGVCKEGEITDVLITKAEYGLLYGEEV